MFTSVLLIFAFLFFVRGASLIGNPNAPLRDSKTLATEASSANPGDVAITPEIDAFAADLILKTHVPGLSVGVIRLNGTDVSTEFRAWGNMTEDGEPVRTEVRRFLGLIPGDTTYGGCDTDAVRRGLLLKGVLGGFDGYPY